MHSDFIFIDKFGSTKQRWPRLRLGETAGRDEAWLRDFVFSSPEILPIRDIDTGFGPLVPLCTELRTEAGTIDAIFLNRDDKLTIVECKLWRNPQARREVVAQTLDYARSLARWSYSDLQRQVSARLKTSGNIPFQCARQNDPDLIEQDFIDATARSLRAGRFLIIILGDGIREDVEAIAELINRNAAAAFQLAVVEAALYDAGEGSLAVQARVLARTRLIERTIIVASVGPQATDFISIADIDQKDPAANPIHNAKSAELRAWWEPVLKMSFDDPDQALPVYHNNYVRAALPWPTLSIAAYRTVNGDTTSVYIGGRLKEKKELLIALDDQIDQLLEEIPGAEILVNDSEQYREIHAPNNIGNFPTSEAHRSWIIETMNAFANALRPRIKNLLLRRVSE